MRNLLFLILAIGLFACNAEKAEYFDTDYHKVLELAQKDPKPIFIDFSTAWCGGCQVFSNTMMNDTIFRNYMERNFYTIYIDGDLESSRSILRKYSVGAYPTFIITNSNGKELGSIAGYSKVVPRQFIERIEGILDGNEELDFLIGLTLDHPDSLLLVREVYNKLYNRKDFNTIQNLSEKLLISSKNDEVLLKAKFQFAYSQLNNPFIDSPRELLYLANSPESEPKLKSLANQYLLFHYWNNELQKDSAVYFFERIMEEDSEKSIYFSKKYARFLFENNLNQEKAIYLAEKYIEINSPADHWTPFLKAHILAKKGNAKTGLELFDDWMTQYSKPENFKDDYWHYNFYLDYVLFYKLSNSNAITYALTFEKMYPQKQWVKRYLSRLYFIEGDIENAILKLEQLKNLIEDPKKKAEVDVRIEEYKQSKI